MKLVYNNKIFNKVSFLNEDELGRAVVKNSSEIFGPKSIYIDIKKRVKLKKNSFISIPDGYVIDFRSVPRLWVVENELSTHDSFRHIGIQLLKFAAQFSEGSFKTKELLLNAINDSKELKEKAKLLVKKNKFVNTSEA